MSETAILCLIAVGKGYSGTVGQIGKTFFNQDVSQRIVKGHNLLFLFSVVWE